MSADASNEIPSANSLRMAQVGSSWPSVLILAALLFSPLIAHAQDCNNNGILDATDIADGTSTDCNANAILDECEIPDGSELLDPAERYDWPSHFVGDAHPGNIDGDGDVDIVYQGDLGIMAMIHNADRTFDNQVLIPDLTPRDIGLGDLDGDGDIDLAEVYYWENELRIHLNDGNGAFTETVLYSTDLLPQALCIADLDGDNDLDIALVTRTNDNLSIFFNNGDATFPSVNHIGVGSHPGALAVGDVDADGDTDIAVANYDDSNITILLNNGDGSFVDNGNYGVLDRPKSVALGDLGGDGDDDLAVANFDSTTFTCIFISNGDGTLSEPTLLIAALEPWDVAIGDVSGDGYADIIVAQHQYSSLEQDNVSVIISNGDGTFLPREFYAAGFQPIAVAIADLDLDGSSDVIITCSNDNGTGDFAIFFRTDEDCNGSGVPDDCELSGNDCNNNGNPDECGFDDDGDGVPNDCDVCPGLNDTIDSDLDSVPDGCEVECTNPVFGDVNGSGTADAADVVIFTSLLLAPASAMPAEFCAADVNEDDYLNSRDIHAFLQIVLAP